LVDAEILRDCGRQDNALYLAGYVAECSLKLLVSHYLSWSAARRYGHDLGALQGAALRQLHVLVPPAHLRVPGSRTVGTVLEIGHPQRRYWPSHHWRASDVETALRRAYDIYRETVLTMILDGHLGPGELSV
jgi:hypothetical protein